MRMRTLAAFALAGLAAACVEARPDDALGSAQFIASSALPSQDYVPANGAGPAGTGALAPPAPAASGAAGGGSVVPPPSTIPPGSAMAGAPAPDRPGAGLTAGTGAAGRAGSAAAAGSGAPAGAAGAAGAPVSTGPAPTGTGGMLTIDFKSVALGGQYAPRNVGAVWIESASGMFVKTLERWAGIRVNHLSRWSMASGGWGSRFGGGGGNTADMMDAVSRATLRSHEMHHVTWTMKDAKGQVVPDGMYNIVIEVADDSRRASTNATVAFVKGPMPQMITAPDKAPWSGLSVHYQP